MSKRRGIPPIPDHPISRDFNKTVKEEIEIIRGERGQRIKHLSADASDADIVAKINEILELIQPR